jgi:hypothetical protein
LNPWLSAAKQAATKYNPAQKKANRLLKRFLFSNSGRIFIAAALGLMCLAGRAPAATQDSPFAAAPQAPWTVGPIAAPSSSGAAYCSMKTRFSGDWNLVLARDMAGYNSVALEAKKNIFTAGSQYAVKLSAGDVVRDKTFIAATGRVLVGQMGVDDDFYTVLSLVDVLGISARSFSVDFALPGAADALKVLDDCANTRARGKSFAPVTVGLTTLLPVAPASRVATPVVAQVENIPPSAAERRNEPDIIDTGRLAALEREVKSLRAENRRISNDLSVAREQASSAAPVAFAPADIEPSAGGASASSLIEMGYDFPQGYNDLDQVASAYINQLAGGCKGDFASQKFHSGEALKAEIACIQSSDNTGQAAALLFYIQDGISKLRVFESSQAEFQQALDAREKFLGAL